MGLKAVATLVPGGGPPVGGSGTSGTIPKWDTTTTLNDSVITQSSVGGVGIGIAPIAGHRVSVSGRIGGGTYGDSYIEFQGSGATALRANNTVNIGYANTVNVTNAGLVGIGTPSPASALDVAGTITCDDVSTGIKLPASPGNADAQTLDCYQESTYTATDTSGAGLVFTVNNPAVCTRVGRLVFVRVDITYPVTANTSPAGLSVPFTSIVAGGIAGAYGGVIGACVVIANGTNFEVYASSPLTIQTNANLSGAHLVFSIWYQAS